MAMCLYCHQSEASEQPLGFDVCEECQEILQKRTPPGVPRQRAVIYLRVSTKRQNDDPDSGIFIQTRHCVEYCFDHNLECHQIYQDVHSAMDLRNAGLRGLHQMIDDLGFDIYQPHRCYSKNPLVVQLRKAIRIASHMILLKRETVDPHIDFIVVDNLDRFGRDLKNMIALNSHFLAEQTQIVAVSQNFQTGTDLGDFAFYQKALEAELFSRDRSIRIKAVKRTKKALGHFLGGRARYGCRVQLVRQIRTVVPDPEEQKVITMAQRLSKSKSASQIAQKLNRTGITKRGRQWTRTSVQTILKTVPDAMEVDTPEDEVMSHTFTQMSLTDLEAMAP